MGCNHKLLLKTLRTFAGTLITAETTYLILVMVHITLVTLTIGLLAPECTATACQTSEDCKENEICQPSPLGISTGTCMPAQGQGACRCAVDECCVDLNRPIGKRKRSIDALVCQKMKDIGDSCLVRYGSGTPTNVLFMCPCKAGLICKGSVTVLWIFR